MKVSVITPSYNQASYIRHTIDSVLTQDYPNIEYFVFDGGSTDGTIEILDSYSDPRMKWVSQPDKGQSDAINQGLQAANGDIMTFINSDDILLPGVISFVVRYFELHTDVDLIHGDTEYIDRDGNLLKVVRSMPYDIVRHLCMQFPFVQQGTFWRRCVYERVGEFDADMHYSFDADYWIRVYLDGCRIEYVPGVRSQFRLHETSKSISLVENFLIDRHAILNKVFADPTLPADLLANETSVRAYVEWDTAKLYWAQRRYDEARPLLHKTRHGGRTRWRILATLMLLETYTGTRMTSKLFNAYRMLTGRRVRRFHDRTSG
jgi:glycosyltransferase involved in cell wall biosynthesis